MSQSAESNFLEQVAASGKTQGRMIIDRDLKSVAVPKPKPMVEKHERQQNFKFLKKEMNNWQDIVDHNRTLKHVHFPLDQPDVTAPSIVDWVDEKDEETPEAPENKDVPNASLVSTIEGMTDKQKRLLSRVQFQTALEKSHRLRLLKRFTIKMGKEQNRVRKIKSKGFHRNRRKQRVKTLENVDVEQLKACQPEVYRNEYEKVEKMRAKERATLKHSGGSKWSRNLLLKGKKNPEIRDALIEQHKMNRKLTVDNKNPIPSSSSEEEPEEDPIDRDIELKLNNLVKNSWFGKRTDGSKKTPAQASTISDSSFVTPKPFVLQSENEPEMASIVDNVKESIRAQHVVPEHDLQQVNVVFDQHASVQVHSDQYLNDVAQAFQDDAAVEEFIEDNAPEKEDAPSKLVGWGSWATPTDLAVPTKVKKWVNPIFKGANSHVIINPNANASISKHLVVNLGSTKKNKLKEFENDINEPIGREWKNQSSFMRSIRPRVTLNAGVPIPPLANNTKGNRKKIKYDKLVSALPSKIRETFTTSV